MEETPCGVCGGTDLNLVGGFYYCVECGTQDTTVRETIVERVELKGGMLAVGTRRKISKKKAKINMSDEWYKWNACNIVLNGLVDDLIVLGAEPSVKPKVLWIWSRLVKKMYNNEEYHLNNTMKQNQLINNNDNEPDNETKNDNDFDDDEIVIGKRHNINPSMKTLIAIIYIALNLDKSDILLSHLMRFICEGRLNVRNIAKYLPTDFPVSVISFLTPNAVLASNFVRERAQILYYELKLGTCLIPDMKKIVSQFIKELCLPKDLKELVYSLMIYSPWEEHMHRRLERSFNIPLLPHFEAVAMAYIVVAMKMCFGLDDDYEIKLSDAVDRINDKENLLKSYRVGAIEPTERLFSFRDWLIYMEFRKIIICKYYQPLTLKYCIFEEECLTAEMLKDEKIVDDFSRLKDRLTFDILNRIQSQTDFAVIPKEEFPVSETPFTAYTEFIIPRLRDHYMRQMLSEDFSRYSLKYACVGLALHDENGDNIIKGVTEDNKCVKNFIMGKSRGNKKVSSKTVFLKNYENDDWKKYFENVQLVNQDNKENAKDDEVCNDSNTTETKDTSYTIESVKQETIAELDENENIFDDVFDALHTDDPSDRSQHLEFQFMDSQIYNMPDNSTPQDEPETNVEQINTSVNTFDPNNFDRKEVIKHLVLSMCRKYLIKRPSKFVDKKPGPPKTDAKKPIFVVPDIGAPKPAKVNPRVQDILDLINKYNSLVNTSATEREPVDAAESQPDVDLNVNDDTEHEPLVFEEDPPPNLDDNIQDTDMEVDIAEDTNTQTDNSQQEVPEFEMAFEDPEINVILSKDLLARRKTKRIKLNKTQDINTELNSEENIDSENEDDRVTIDLNNLEPYTEVPEDFQNFKYYTRQYMVEYWGSASRSGIFEAEMNEALPVSLKYVLQTCAVVSQTSAYHIYKQMDYIENNLIKRRLKYNRKTFKSFFVNMSMSSAIAAKN